MKALIADHSRTARRILREVLSDIAPEIEVDNAETGDQAVAMHETRSYGLIFLDIFMPDMDGLAALTAIREADPRTFIVMLSALEDVRVLEHAERAGASAFIAKPFSSLDVQSALAPVTRREPTVRLLIIDDSRAQRAILRAALAGLGVSCVIDEAEDGPQGLIKALGRSYDLAFIDINMPGLQGTDVLREIKRAQKRTKVVMTSADLPDSVVRTIGELGGDACVKKPIKIPEVLVTAAELLDARRPARRPAA